jgi:hypothetical protein
MAWYEPRRRVGVYFPAPLNWIARAWRELRYRLHIALGAPGIEAAQFFTMQRLHQQRQRMAEEYARGYMVGWRECLHACVEAIEDEMSRGDDVWEIGALLTDGGSRGRTIEGEADERCFGGPKKKKVPRRWVRMTKSQQKRRRDADAVEGETRRAKRRGCE